MAAAEGEVLDEHVALVIPDPYNHSVTVQIGSLLDLLSLGERQHLGLAHNVVEVPDSDLVIGAEDEAVILVHVPDYTELSPCIFVDVVVVAVQMVRGDVGQNGDVGLEVIHIVQLETAEFQNMDVMVLRGHEHGVALPDVAAQPHVQTRLLEQVVDQRGRSGLAVASRDADLLRRVITPGEFDFRDYMDACIGNFPDNRGAQRNAWAFDHLIGIENELLGVGSALERNVPVPEHCGILVPDLPAVGKKDIEPFDFCEDRSTHAALTAS